MSHAITKITLHTKAYTLTIKPSTLQVTNAYLECAIEDCTLTITKEPCDVAPLLYVPHPAPGQACIQAQEQTAYDVWLTWEVAPMPQVLVGYAGEALSLKRQGKQAYAVLNWRNYVGATKLVIDQGDVKTTLPIEVRARKLGYLDDYREMLDAISEWLAALVFHYDSPTSVYTQRAVSHPHIAYLDYLFLRALFTTGRLSRYFNIIAGEPHRQTQRESIWVRLEESRTCTPRALHTLYAHPEHLTRPSRVVAPGLQAQLKGYVPRQLQDERSVTTYDTAPNRFVRHFLQQLMRKLRELEGYFAGDSQGQHLVADCTHWRHAVERMLRDPFLREVGPMHTYPAGSQVLLKREGYRQCNAAYRRFLLTGKVMWEDFDTLLQTPNKDLATLYEYWGFFQLLDATADVLNTSIDPRDFIVEESDIFWVRINQRGRSRGRIGEVTLYYNRYFRPQPGESYSVTLHPDYVIEMPDGRRYVFDAKYKYTSPTQFMDRALLAHEEAEERVALTYKKADLYKMHTYRDALDAQAVFILYPGTVFSAFGVNQRRYDDPAALPSDFAGVGALPLAPGQYETLAHVLRKFLLS
jgi:hypothetical protein